MTKAQTGWDASAEAWLATMGEDGDWGRRAVLDPVMRELAGQYSGTALDIGCGEGRFVRMLRDAGFSASGIDPTARLIEAARAQDAGGDYHVCGAEALPFADASFDLCVAYLSLIDIELLDQAIAEAVRVTKAGGAFLIANLSSINSAGAWEYGLTGKARHYAVDDYMTVREVRQRWNGIDIVNWHRPFSTYFELLLRHGFVLKRFLEPMPHGDYRGKDPKFERVPNFVVMLWEKLLPK
jgi:SAM-dependent methyltransferase